MKTKLCLLLFTAFSSLMMTIHVADTLTDFGLTKEGVHDNLFTQLIQPEWIAAPTGKMRIARKIPVGDRAAAASNLVKIAQSIVSSDAFKNEYDAYIEQNFKVETLSDEEQKLINGATIDMYKEEEQTIRDTYKSSIMTTTQGFENMPPSVLTMMAQQHVTAMEQQLGDMTGAEKEKNKKAIAELKSIQRLSTSNPNEFKTKYLDFFKRLTTGTIDERPSMVTQEDFDNKKAAAFEKNERIKQQQTARDTQQNLNTVVKNRLKTFISLVESVDFEATTVKDGSIYYFTNKAYEKKPKAWKLLYRLGKEPVIAAKVAAQNWIKAI
jgi:uncharacterized protein (UPF0335 family)